MKISFVQNPNNKRVNYISKWIAFNPHWLSTVLIVNVSKRNWIWRIREIVVRYFEEIDVHML